MLRSLGAAEVRGFSGVFSKDSESVSTVAAMYRCMSNIYNREISDIPPQW